MQCPPSPGPGWNDMKPKGFVAAASTTSQTSIPIRSQSCASSLTSAMLTERKMFSRSLVSSAASGEDTRCTSSTTAAYSAAAASVDSSVTPPTTFGTFFVVQSSRPGSTRSGENARWKSRPTVRPLPASRTGSTCSRVVPGYVVDSSTTRWPGLQPRRDLRRGRVEDPEVRLALARERRGQRDDDRVRLAKLVVVRRRRIPGRRRRAARARRRGRPRCSSPRG